MVVATGTELLIGEQADNELQSTHRWIVFNSATNFSQPLSADFILTNLDAYPVAYCLKARDRTMFVISEPYGLLQAHEERRLRLFLKRGDSWSRDVTQLLGRHQIAVENLRLPEGVRAADLKAGRQLAREVFKRSGDKSYMQRLFWRINVVLVKKDKAASTTGKEELVKSLTPSTSSFEQEEDGITASDLFNSLEVGYWLLYAADRATPEEKTRLLEWYLRALVNYGDPIDHVDFLNMITRFFEKTNVQIGRTELSPSGQLIPQKEFRLNLQKTPLEISDLKTEFKEMMTEFSEQQGRVSKEEMEELEAEIADWKSKAQPGGAIVIDALNILHRGDINPFVKRLRRLYNNVFIVSRPFTRGRLESGLWPINTRKFFASDDSEDDLMAIYAALEWGPDCFLLSNDRFKKHSDHLSDSGSKSFQNWYKKRNIRINHAIGAFGAPNVFAEKPRLLTSQKKEAILLPVQADTSLLPYYTFWLVRVPQNITIG